MKRRTVNRANILLMEIIIALLFFSVASAVCIQIFVKAHLLGQDSKALNFATTQTSSMAELLRYSNDAPSTLSPYYGELSKEYGGYCIYFDKKYNICEKEDYFYRILIISKPKEDFTTHILYASTKDSREPYYKLPVVAYKPQKGAL
ncbi:MAG TPA: hypothetical protein H9887_03735 [Candidatus Dorea intestinavium]|nr:hypothetical protein [Candidatus Dorea intestinavium]